MIRFEKVKAYISNLFFDFIQVQNDPNRKELEEELLKVSSKRFRLFAVLLMLFSVYALFMDYQFFLREPAHRFYITNLMVLRMGLVCASVFYLLIYHLMKKHMRGLFLRILITFMAYSLLFITTAMSVNSQLLTGNINAYLIGVFSASFSVYLPLIPMTLLYLLNFIIFVTGVALVQQDFQLQWTNILNGTVALIAFLINSTNYLLKMHSLHTERELARANISLQEANLSLDRRVQEEVEESRRKDELITLQNRQAMIGEMIGNITHQWRQPLNLLGLLLQNLSDDIADKGINDQTAIKTLNKSYEIVLQMNQTMEDFRNFYKLDKVKEGFSAWEKVEKVLELMQEHLELRNIQVIKKQMIQGTPSQIMGYPNEFFHVLLNLFSNAKDALQDPANLMPVIEVTYSQEREKAILLIADNGGGIPNEFINKIFEPYFTTKESGTGMGLAMSKTIIEKHMNGSISAKCYNNWTEFRIELPLFQNG